MKNQKLLKAVHLLGDAVCLLIVVLVCNTIFTPSKAYAQSGNVYGYGQAQVSASTEEATVLQVQRKSAQPGWQSRTAGAGIGSALGTLLALQAGGSNRMVANVLGATLGGIAGERATNSMMTEDAQEIVLKVTSSNGRFTRILTIVQPAPYTPVVAGQDVYLVNTAGVMRVIPKIAQPVAYAVPGNE